VQDLLHHRDGVSSPPLLECHGRQRAQRLPLHLPVGERSRPTEILLVHRAGAFVVAELLVHPPEEASGEQRVVLVADVAEEPGAVTEEPPSAREVILIGEGKTEHDARVGGSPHVAELPIERQRFLGTKLRRLRVAALARHQGHPDERLGASFGRRSVATQ
jgi:hypothetical protein